MFSKDIVLKCWNNSTMAYCHPVLPPQWLPQRVVLEENSMKTTLFNPLTNLNIISVGGQHFFLYLKKIITFLYNKQKLQRFLSTKCKIVNKIHYPNIWKESFPLSHKQDSYREFELSEQQKTDQSCTKIRLEKSRSRH